MKRTLFSFAAAILLSGCAIENEPGGSGQTAVEFTGNVTQILTRVGGTNGTTWHADDPVGIYMVKADPGTLSDGNILSANKHYKASAGNSASFTPGDGTHLFYPSDGSGVKFTAYHPHTTSVGADHKVPFSVADQSDLSDIDLLHAPVTASFSRGSTGAVPLVFTHKLTKLIFNVSNGAGVTEPVANGIDVAISGQKKTGTLDLANDGAIAATGETSVLTASGAATIEAIVLPNSDLSDVTFTFTNDAGQSFLVDPPTASWQGGKQYTYTVTLKAADKSSEISGSIDPWGDGGTQPITGEEQTGNPAGRIRMSLDPTGLTRAGGGSIGFGVAGTGMVTIEWGDGEQTNASINTSAETFFPHTYAESAVYVVTVSGDIWSLDCSRSGLIGLDISAAPGLVTLKCSGNKLTDFVHDDLSLPELDLSGDTALTELVINTANTKKLDVSGCRALVTLTAKPGSGVRGALETLNITDCTALEFIDCRWNKLEQIDLSTNPVLEYLYCLGNEFEELDVADNPALHTLWCHTNDLKELDVTQNPLLVSLSCSINPLTELNLSQNTVLNYLDCGSTQLTELNLLNNPDLSMLFCTGSNFGSLNLSANRALVELNCESAGLTELDLSNNPNLHYLNCAMNDLTEIIFSDEMGPGIQYLDCSSNRLASLKLNPEWHLRWLDCSNNQIRYITDMSDADIAVLLDEIRGYVPDDDLPIELARRITEYRPLRFVELNVLQCSQNRLTGLNLECPAWGILVCADQNYVDEQTWYSYNDFQRINLMGNPYLIDLSGNHLTPGELDDLISRLPFDDQPLPEWAIVPYRQICIGQLPYDGYLESPVVTQCGWDVTGQSPHGGWEGFSPVLKNFLDDYISGLHWPYRLQDYRLLWDMAHGGVIWLRGNNDPMPEGRRLAI